MTVLDVFREMPTLDLVVLRHAFITDRDAPNSSKQTIAFCRERIGIIDDILKERDTKGRG